MVPRGRYQDYLYTPRPLGSRWRGGDWRNTCTSGFRAELALPARRRESSSHAGQGYAADAIPSAYPACPNFSDDQRTMLKLLGADAIGVSLTEGGSRLDPEQSTSAIVWTQTQAKSIYRLELAGPHSRRRPSAAP